MVPSHLPKGTQSMSGIGRFCCLSWQGDHDDAGQCYKSKFSSLVICTGGGLMLFSYVQILFIYDCCIAMLLVIRRVISSILTCWSPGYESSVKATVRRLKNIEIYMVFCIYTTTTLQFRFHHCYCIIRMLMQSFWAKGKFMIMFNYHVSTHLQRYSLTLQHYSAIYYDHITILLHEYSYRRYVIIFVLH